jgi:putative acetyltransferase
MPDTLSIRPFAESDHAAVRDLFIAINRALAPEEMRETFDNYIETALAAEIDRIGSFYSREGGNGFWVAHVGPLLVGTVGLERPRPKRSSFGACMSERSSAVTASRRRCSRAPPPRPAPWDT